MTLRPLGSALLTAAALLLGARAGRAELRDTDHASSRKLLEDEYLDEYQGSNAIYQSAPVTHVIPSNKTITFALAAQKLDVKLKSDRFASGYLTGQRAVQTMKLSGTSFAPYVAVSLKKVGLGFSAETGTRNVLFRVDGKDVPEGDASFAKAQYSEAKYTAIGVYGYLLPLEITGERPVVGSLILGARSYDVTHKVSSIENPDDVGNGVTKFRYDLLEYEVGALVEYRLLKRFSLMPWVDYTYMDVHDPVSQADEILRDDSGASATKVRIAHSLKGDTMMFWRARPRVDLGLDLIAKVGELTIHLGELFGYLIDKPGTDVIRDNGFYVSVAWDMQGE